MKVHLFASLVLLTFTLQQGESTVTRTILQQILEAVNKATGTIVVEADDYFIEKLKNETQIQEWSVDIQAKVVTGVANAVFSVLNVVKNVTDLKILDCIADEEPTILVTLEQAARDNGWCNNRLAANLTRAFEDVTRHMVDRNEKFKTYLTTLETCTSSDDKCFNQYVSSVASYIETEFGDGDTLESALKEVVAVYKIMFGQDVPACNEKYLFPEIFAGFRSSVNNIINCFTS